MPSQTLGTDPNYESQLYGNRNPRMLMAQKLMELAPAPANNSTQSSFWANLLNQGARGALGGWMYKDALDKETADAEAQKTEAEKFARERPTMGGGGMGGQSAAPPEAPQQQKAAGDGYTGGEGGGPLYAAAHHLESRGRMAPGIMGDGGQAAGPMQVHPGALADVNKALGTNYTHQQLAADPATGKLVGDTYLGMLRHQFGRDDYALGAYNAGPGVMRNAIASGKGIAGLPDSTQQYVAQGLAHIRANSGSAPQEASTAAPAPAPPAAPAPKVGPAMARGGQQVDATPTSPIDALMRGVNAPKPRGIQLAENLVPGTATDSPTPILPPQPEPTPASVPDNPMTRADPATLANINGLPLPDQATAPAPDASSAPYPQPAMPAPAVPADVPPPAAAAVPPAPEPTPLIGNPQAGMDQGALANFNGQPPPPTAATVPLPEPPVVPQPAPAQVPRPPAAAVPAPAQAPPASAPPGQGDNTTEALNTASLAAAQAGQNYVPPGAGGGPTGPQLAAPLWAGNLTPDGAPLLTPAGAPSGPTGPQLAAPLMPPGAAPAGPTGQGVATPVSDTSAAGGQPKGPAPAQGQQPQRPGLPSQDYVDQLSVYAERAAASSNPRIRAQAGALAAEAQHMQRRIDTFALQGQRQQDRADARADSAANRNLPIHDLEGPDGQIHSYQVAPDGRKIDLGLAANQRVAADKNLPIHELESPDDHKIHAYQVAPDGRKIDLGLASKQRGEGGSYAGTGLQQQDSAKLDALTDKIANGTATEDEKRQYSRAYNRAQSGTPTEIQDPRDPSRTIKVPGQPTDLTGYAPPPYKDTTVMPGKPPTETERKNAGYARRMDLANTELDRLGPRSFGDVLAGKVPMVGNYLTSAEGQQFRTAAEAWLMAKLRPESGAVIGAKEMQDNFEIYFPMPGDSPQRIELKRQLRDLETKNSRIDAGNAYTPEPAAAGGGGGNVPPEGSIVRQGGRTYKIINGQAVAQ